MRQTIRRDRLIGPGDRIVIGLSGGADSVTLSVLLPQVAGKLARRSWRSRT
jgi:tRNA(Ile)-lysidine synthase TilS/MesJ